LDIELIAISGHVEDNKTYDIMKAAYDVGVNFFGKTSALTVGSV
jgi:hypothetical protein